MRNPKRETVQRWHEAIEERGTKRMKLRMFLSRFGVSRRGERVIAEIQRRLKDVEFPGQKRRIHVDGLDARSLDSRVTLSHERIARIGHTWDDDETTFKDDYGATIIGKLGLQGAEREYRPRGTRDKFDYLCRDPEGRPVVLEIKLKGGQKRAVEQLLRYIGELKREDPNSNPRGILVTGVGDLHTRNALRGQDQDRHIDWYGYGLTDNGGIRLKRMRVPRSRRGM